jgi:type I restriction enzyme, S subunit
MKKLDQVLKYHQPTKFIVSKDKYDDKFDIPVLTAGKSFILGYTDEQQGVFDNLPAIIFDDFTTSFHLVDFPFKVKSSAMKILVPISKEVDIRYVYFQMLGLRIDTALHKRYWISKFSKLEIPLPPLETQKRIAQILDDANALRQKTEKLLEEYDTLAQSIFLDMFGNPVTNPKGWEKIKLGEITNMKAGKFVAASEISSKKNSKLYPCYGGNGLRGFVKSYTHQGKFVLIGRQGALCGNVKIADGVFHATEHAIVCTPNIEYDTLWLYFLLDIINLNRYATGAAQPGLNVGNLVKLEMPFAPIDLQKLFSKKIALIEKQKALAKQELAESEDLFNCLLQKAFKGELV